MADPGELFSGTAQHQLYHQYHCEHEGHGKDNAGDNVGHDTAVFKIPLAVFIALDAKCRGNGGDDDLPEARLLIDIAVAHNIPL